MNTNTLSGKLDRAALLTLATVSKAMRVRSLSLSEAMELVAKRTGTDVEHVGALLARAAMVAQAAD